MSLEVSDTDQQPKLDLSQRWHWASQQAISFLMQQAVENIDCISLAAGLVDQDSLPVELTRKACESLLSDVGKGRQVLQYGTTPGAEPIRKVVLDHFARLEKTSVDQLGITPQQLVLTTGSQQLLSIVGEVLFDPGDICLVAAPTYFVFLGVLEGIGARAIPVKTDDQGMCPDALEETLKQLEEWGELDRVKMIYLVSYYENPSGVSLATDRRPRMVEIAKKWSKHHRITILEDAAYRELRYDAEEYPSVWSFDKGGQNVILTQTFSKSYSPGLRVGFGILPQDLVKPVCDRKGNEDFGSANLNQHIIATVLASGDYQEHVERVRQSYRVKRDAMLKAADKYFTDLPGVSWVHPHGGLYVWMTLPEHVQTGFSSPLFEIATRQEKVMYVPGELCFAGTLEHRPHSSMRLSYGVQKPDGIDLGMQRLANAVRAVL